MQVLQGTGDIPFIFTAHHASHNFGEFTQRVALSPEQQIRFSDYGTDQTVPLIGTAVVVADHSRALGDLNRDPDDPGRFQDQDYAKPIRHAIWLPGQSLTDAEKQYCQQHVYEPFHRAIIALLQKSDQPRFVVSWDNTAHYEIGNDEAGNPVIMRPIILSNRGREGSGEPGNEPVSCDPAFLTLLATHLRRTLTAHGLPNEVCLNLAYKGGYICRQYSTLRNAAALAAQGVRGEVQSFQVEYDTAITHGQATLRPHTAHISALRQAMSEALIAAYREFTAVSGS